MRREWGGRAGCGKADSSALSGPAFHQTTSRVILSHVVMDPGEDLLYLSGPLFTKTVSFLSERREEGRKEKGREGGREKDGGKEGGREEGREEGETSTERKCQLILGPYD